MKELQESPGSEKKLSSNLTKLYAEGNLGDDKTKSILFASK